MPQSPRRNSQVVGHADRNASEQAHFLDLAPGQQYGLRHEYVLDHGNQIYGVFASTAW